MASYNKIVPWILDYDSLKLKSRDIIEFTSLLLFWPAKYLRNSIERSSENIGGEFSAEIGTIQWETLQSSANSLFSNSMRRNIREGKAVNSLKRVLLR